MALLGPFPFLSGAADAQGWAHQYLQLLLLMDSLGPIGSLGGAADA